MMMKRYPQSTDSHGSLKWTQKLINEKPELLNAGIKNTFSLAQDEKIEWVSPLKSDEYAEYRDDAFIQKLGINLNKKTLKEFWPNGGPQWDALGRTNQGKCFLVEAKAHVGEIVSKPSQAEGRSLEKIKRSLDETKQYVNSKSSADWSSYFYQYTNRLTHLYFLWVLNSIPTYLIFIYFLNDKEMKGPETKAEWLSALKVMKKYLGIRRNKLNKFVGEMFIDVRDLQRAIE
ncbi:hypothetical protein ACFL1N_09550 [Thermodesulfobacteriota bacterium]